MSSYAWQGIFHHSVFQIFGTFAVLFWACIPIRGFINGSEKKLPLDGWYPYDVNNNLAFILTWTHQGVAIVLCCINDLATDSFITGLINVASCQFELLKWNFAALGNNLDEQNLMINLKENCNNNNNNNKINKKLHECIKHNLAIFDFIKEIQNIFSTVIGLQLFVSCFIICLSIFYLSQLTTFNPAEIIGNGAYILCMTYQIFIYTWQGNELYLQNEALAGAIYMGSWWKLDSRFRRNLHIIMLRTQKPLILTTKFLITLTIPTFMSIIQTSYSMFTLLHRKNL
ncbi:odorant receptor Or1-like [Leptopilina boulardi]|uniref:odorant receptor Or1-like n=1 Tax=Leptopilina boulardi TaxID=63433 RepID=UPI0021F57D2E|nr:odorant receptor Or1-like [Leptopilina boulardi]